MRLTILIVLFGLLAGCSNAIPMQAADASLTTERTYTLAPNQAAFPMFEIKQSGPGAVLALVGTLTSTNSAYFDDAAGLSAVQDKKVTRSVLRSQ